MNRWTKSEEQVLIKYYPDLGTLTTILDRTPAAIRHKFQRISGRCSPYKPLVEEKRIGYFDIETSQLQADFGICYSWVIKVKGKNEYYGSIITRNEIIAGMLDKRVMEELMDAFQNFDIIYTYYGSRFDIPFVRTRTLIHGLEFIPRGQIIHRDLYYLARRCLKLSSNRLANVCRVLGIEGKTNIEQRYWVLANTGNPTALKYIAEHNKGDVDILEKVHEKLSKFEAPSRRWM